MKGRKTDWENFLRGGGPGEGNPGEENIAGLFDDSLDLEAIDHEIRELISDPEQTDLAADLEKIEVLIKKLKECTCKMLLCMYQGISWQNREEGTYFLQDPEPGSYSKYICEYLCLAAEKEKETFFDLFLTKSCKINLWRERMAGIEAGIFSRNEERKNKRKRKLIYTKSVWLEKVIRKCGIQNEVFEKRQCNVPQPVETDVPGLYMSILAGETKLVKFYLTHGVELHRDDTEDCLLYADFLHHSFGYWIQWNFEIKTLVKCRHELGYAIKFPGKNVCGFYELPISKAQGYELLVHDPFTMAILSQNKEMIRFIADLIGRIEWNENMEQSIVYTNYDITALLLKEFPEILDYLCLTAILQGKNTVLLKAFRKKRRNTMEKEEQTAKKFLHWYTREACLLLKEAAFWHCSGMTREVSFFRELLTGIQDPEFRELAWEFLCCEWILTEKNERRGRERFIELLLSNPDDALEKSDAEGPTEPEGPCVTECLHGQRDFTEIFFHMQDTWYPKDWSNEELFENLLVLMRPISREKGFRRFRIDLYTDKWKEIKINYIRQGILFMKLFVPLYISPQADVINQEIIRTGSGRIVRAAVRRGFITEKNAWALYQYALEIGILNEEILTLLLELLQGRSLKERYTERKSL